jgi:MoaA/NifB/PqqE/SkfB family radical SAM enzyme
MDIHDTFNQHPNFTVLVPGTCNAACAFCFWNHKDGLIRPPADYLERLHNTLLRLPKNFRAISISGGEPTTSTYLMPILEVIKEVRTVRAFDRVVMTTNGSSLPDLLAYEDFPGGVVDFINISRHHYEDAENRRIFRSVKIPGTNELFKIIRALKIRGVPVTLNCVVNDLTTQSFIFQFMDFFTKTGAHTVSFRKEASTIEPTPVEKMMISMFGAGESNNCPVCRVRNQNLLGHNITWKGSVTEPSVECGKTYEGVFHPDGNLYADWARKHHLKVGRVIHNKIEDLPGPATEAAPVVYSCGGSRTGCGFPVTSSMGCGSTSGGCGSVSHKPRSQGCGGGC